MSEQKERGDVEQALNELAEATRLGLTEGVKLASKRLDALGVSVKRRTARLRQSAFEEDHPDVEVEKLVESKPVDRKAPGATSKVAAVKDVEE